MTLQDSKSPIQENNSNFIKSFYSALWENDGTDKSVINYALLDGASSEKIFPMLKQSDLRYDCLYEGKLSYDMELSAPYLVRLEEGNEYVYRLLEKGLGKNWFIILKTFKPVTMLSILRLARRNHKIQTPESKTLIFRYFDPRIIRNYLPYCTIDEANSFFTMIDEIICEGSEPHEILKLTRTDHGVLDTIKINLQERNIKKSTYSNKIDILPALKISQHQLEILGKSKLPEFYKRASEYVINEFPHFANNLKTELIIWVEQTYNQGCSFDLVTERDHFKFINYKCIFGNDFMETYDFAEPILQAPIKPGLKLARLKDAFMEQLNS